MLRLSELLDRFRPAGSPGASVATGGAAVVVPPSELDSILAELRRHEAEAAAVIEDASMQATKLRDAAHERARQIRSGLPEACAAAQADAATQHRHALEPSVAAVSAESARAVERLRTSTPERIASVVAEVLAGVRASAQAPHATSVGSPPT